MYIYYFAEATFRLKYIFFMILERHDCEEHGRCSEELYTADGWQEAHRVLGAHQASCRLQVRGDNKGI